MSDEERTCRADDNEFVSEINELASMYPVEQLKRESRIYKALSDPIRLKILKLLSHMDLAVCELEVALKISQPTISYHLRILELAGLIKGKRVKRLTVYCLADKKVIEAIKNFETLIPAY